MSSPDSREGVYYPKSAFLSVWSRLLIGLIDLVVVGVISVVFAAALFAIFPELIALGTSVFGLIMISILYFVVMKRTVFRTIGYRLFHVQVVSLRGDRPSIFQMLNRFIFMLVGPLNGLIDLLWVATDDSKQSLHDKWSQTYVIRDTAEPEGRGPIRMQKYGIMGFNFLFAEVFEGSVHAP